MFVSMYASASVIYTFLRVCSRARACLRMCVSMCVCVNACVCMIYYNILYIVNTYMFSILQCLRLSVSAYVN